MGKIKLLSELLEIRKKLKNKTFVFTSGCFDILHPGHIKFLSSAKAFGDILVVALNGDKSPFFKTKGPGRPVFNEIERVEILSAIEYVDYIILFNEDNPLDIIKKLQPDIKIKGGTYIPERVEEEDKIVESYGGHSMYIKSIGTYSSSKIINKIESINRQSAKKYLSFEFIEKKAKTDVWLIKNKETGEYIGKILWDGAWRQYVSLGLFDSGMRMSKGCHREIADFIELL